MLTLTVHLPCLHNDLYPLLKTDADFVNSYECHYIQYKNPENFLIIQLFHLGPQHLMVGETFGCFYTFK